MASYTIYSNAGDGAIRKSDANFTTARSATDGDSVATGGSTGYTSCGLESGTTYNFYIGFFMFDTSVIASSETIDSATFSFSLTGDNSGTAGNQWAVTQSTQDTWNSITTADYDQRGSTEGATRANRKVSTETGYQDFALNTTGKSWIARSGETKPASASATGKTQVVMAWAKDLDNSAPATNDYNQIYFSEQTGTTNDPKLVIETTAGPTYTLAMGTGTFALTGNALGLICSRKLTMGAGTYTLTGIDVALKALRKLVCAVGSYVLTGIDATITFFGWQRPTRDSSTFTRPTRDSSTWSRPDNPKY